MIAIINKPPWERKIRPDAGREEQERHIEEIISEKKKWKTGKWARWERGRRKRLSERRDYFRKHPEKRDDYSGV